jgi:hypothetical protein
MAFEIEIKGKPISIKFNYQMVFKANKKLANKDEKGNSQNDGAGSLFARIIDEDDDAIVDIIKLYVGDKASEKDILDGIEKYVTPDDDSEKDEEEAYQALFDNVKEEMRTSGFFVKKVKKYLENMEKAQQMLAAKEDSNSKAQAKSISELILQMKKEIS